MNFKRVLKEIGFLLIAVGIFIIISQPFSTTGAVIDLSSSLSRIWFFVGLGAAALGVIFLIVGQKRLEGIVDISELSERINSIEAGAEKRSLILDTSMILAYQDSPKQLGEVLQSYRNVFVPDSVLDEIVNLELKSIIRKHSNDIDGYEKYRSSARGYLERTEKPTIRKELLPYLNGEKEIRSGSEQVHLNKITKRLRNIMKKEGKDLDWAIISPKKTRREIKEYLKNCEVSKTDIDVLAMALYEARYKQHAIVGEKDVDLKQAIDLIKKEHPKLGKNLDYAEVYKEEYVHAA